MPAVLAQRIIREVAAASADPPTKRELVRRLRLSASDEDRQLFDSAMALLAKESKIELGSDGRLRLPPMPDEVEGSFRLNRRGFGFVICDTASQEGDLFIPAPNTGGALGGDRVRASITGRRAHRGNSNQPQGRIDEVLKRANSVFSGRLVKKRGSWMVEPDGRNLHSDVLVHDPHARGAGEGAKVIFELTSWPDGDHVAEGVITKVLGAAGLPDVETEAVIIASGFSTEFTEEALQEARSASSSFHPLDDDDDSVSRESLVESFIFTIDPPDARDFDDAISIERHESKDEWTLGVHIADVARFVPAGGPLDVEAVRRGNSVYLPRHVIPMLPEVLSNGVCSLQEGVERYTMSAFIRYDRSGQVLSQRFARTVINSRKRMTYLEAQALIEGDPVTAAEHARSEPVYPPELLEALSRAETLAKILRKRRRRDGMIVLDLPESDILFNDDGDVEDVLPEDGAFTHTLIEMFMVEANEAVARLFDDLTLPLLRRIHPEPSFDDLVKVRGMVSGHGVKIPDHPERKDLQRVLDATRGTPAARSVHFAILRSLTKATYSPMPIGHFALASNQYAHFTSPIRRYPDLTVHRALDAWLDATENGRSPGAGGRQSQVIKKMRNDDRVLDEAALVVLGNQCSTTEEMATAAERDLKEYFILRHLEAKYLGEELPAVISGFNRGGLFVSLDRFLVDGSIQWSDVGEGESKRPDRWVEVHGMGQVVAQRSGAILAIGDPITVQVVLVNPGSRYLELRLLNRPQRFAKPGDAKQKRPAPKHKRKRRR
jgi:ribonuclease R